MKARLILGLMLFIVCAMALMLLSGCTPHPSPVITQQVDVPVAVSCEQGDLPLPQWRTDALAGNATYSQELSAVLQDLSAARAYVDEAAAQLAACK